MYARLDLRVILVCIFLIEGWNIYIRLCFKFIRWSINFDLKIFGIDRSNLYYINLYIVKLCINWEILQWLGFFFLITYGDEVVAWSVSISYKNIAIIYFNFFVLLGFLISLSYQDLHLCISLFKVIGNIATVKLFWRIRYSIYHGIHIFCPQFISGVKAE